MTWTEPKDCFFQTEDDVRSSEFFLRVGTMANHMANIGKHTRDELAEKIRKAQKSRQRLCSEESVGLSVDRIG